MKKILGMVLVLAGLFCLNSCKNYIDQLRIAGNKYKMTDAIPISENAPYDAGMNIVGSNCILTFNDDGSTYKINYNDGDERVEASSGTYEVNTAGGQIVLRDSNGGSTTYTFSNRGSELQGIETWDNYDFSVTYRIQ